VLKACKLEEAHAVGAAAGTLTEERPGVQACIDFIVTESLILAQVLSESCAGGV
jgi:hypothetical protein